MADATEPYLPPGWTEEMYENPKEHAAAWGAITDEQFERLLDRPVNLIPVRDTTSDAAAQLLAPCVEAIEEAGLEEWGFSIFRVDYSDDQAWATFQLKFKEMIEEQLTPASGAGIDAVKKLLRISFVEDEEQLDLASPRNVQFYTEYYTTFAKSVISPRFSVVLMANEEVMKSASSYEPRSYPPETSIREQRRGAPWVLAIDTDLDSDVDVPDEEAEEGNSLGRLKVAITSLVNEFFPIMALGRLSLEELIPNESDDGIWFSV